MQFLIPWMPFISMSLNKAFQLFQEGQNLLYCSVKISSRISYCSAIVTVKLYNFYKMFFQIWHMFKTLNLMNFLVCMIGLTYTSKYVIKFYLFLKYKLQKPKNYKSTDSNYALIVYNKQQIQEEFIKQLDAKRYKILYLIDQSLDDEINDCIRINIHKIDQKEEMSYLERQLQKYNIKIFIHSNINQNLYLYPILVKLLSKQFFKQQRSLIININIEGQSPIEYALNKSKIAFTNILGYDFNDKLDTQTVNFNQNMNVKQLVSQSLEKVE